MTPIEKIKFSFPCKEDLNKMTPCSLGLHCSSCDKTVIDFRNRDLSELTTSLQEHGTICGIFSETQVQQTKSISSFRRLAASLLITVGLGTTSKDLFAQTQACDSLTHKHTVEEESDIIFGTIVETMPTFKNGGDKGLMDFLAKNIKYPKDCVQGRVYVGFTVDTTGKPLDIKIVRGLSEEADREVLRIVELLEFFPGTLRGKKVAVRYNLPVTFSLDKDKMKRK